MSIENCPDKFKPRFKGVENFLRRIAFNLGNTPSQTEVKIISCIPIDVTDLQQKIVDLEKELEETKAKTGQVQNTLTQWPLWEHKSVPGDDPGKVFPAYSCEQCDSSRGVYSEYKSPDLDGLRTPRSPTNCSCWLSNMSDASDQHEPTKEYKRGFFKKTKKNKSTKKKGKCKMQLVYYTQTPNSPFTYAEETSPPNNKIRKPTSKTISHNYLTEMIQKQYTSSPIAEEISISSQFSAPVCRDTSHSRNYDNRLNYLDQDLCSCFHDSFGHKSLIENRDLRTNIRATSSYSPRGDNTDFYDTSLYDMVPVKEGNVKNSYTIKDNHKRTAKEIRPTHHVDKCSPKHKYNPFVVNYNTIPSPYYYSKKIPVRVNHRKEKYRPTPTTDLGKRIKCYEDSSKSCSINCGPVYTKKIHVGAKAHVAQDQVIRKNVECLTTNMNDTECQTNTSQSVQIDYDFLDDKKTEETLNQIKDILQTVLLEVKTKSQSTKLTGRPTKDAVVQKGLSNGNMPGCPNILQSYTFSPYNIDPYRASCSRQMTTAPCCFPNMPPTTDKYIQQFPVFIQTPRRNICTTCYRNSSHSPKETCAKMAATATNTDSKECSKETEKLIKEIYKSMAVNMEFPSKNVSASEYEGIKTTPRRSLNKFTSRGNFVSENINEVLKTSTTSSSRHMDSKPSPMNTLNSKPHSNTFSIRSQVASSIDSEQVFRKNRLEKYLENVESQKNYNKIEEEREYEDTAEGVATTSEEEEDLESCSDETVEESDIQQVKKKPEKRGLLSKMFKRFSLKSKTKEPSKLQEYEDSDDTEDYITVCSQTEKRNEASPRRANKNKTQSKKVYPKQMHNKRPSNHRSPCTGQEFRRQWTENLMYHDNKYMYPSESRWDSNVRPPLSPVYWQNYDTRNFTVRQNPAVNAQTSYHEGRVPQNILTPSRLSRGPKLNVADKLSWLKKHKMGIKCGKDWKRFLTEN